MSPIKFRIVGNSLVGAGLSFEIEPLVDLQEASTTAGEPKSILDAVINIADVVYREGRASALISREDRFDLHFAVDVLRALAVVVGPTPTGDRHRRAADLVGQLLQDQGEGT